MITTDEIRRILLDNRIVTAGPGELDDDTPLVMDSVALVWLLYALEEEHGIVADPDDHELEQLTSVRGIHGYLLRSGPTTAAE